VSEAARRHCHQVPPKQAGHDRIDRETIIGDHHIRPGSEEGVAEDLDHLVRSVTKHQMGRAYLQPRRQPLLEIEGVAVWIKMHLANGGGHGFQCLG
jgi:hypothetical protein